MAWTPPPDEYTVTVKFPKPKPFTLDPDKTALVIVDMENYFCKVPGRERMFDVIDGNVRLLAKAREAGVKVIFIQSLRSPDALEFTVFKRHLHILEGTDECAIVDELQPLPDEIVVQKRSHDPFNHTRLDDVLVEEGIEPGKWTILVTGVSAATCARAAALGFSHRDYMVLIPMDCTAAALDQEAMTYAQYMTKSYDYNMDFTLADLITFERSAETSRTGAAAEPAAV
jgi:ureidoacrylate peracid hydrolase